jgi:hypothetical protein
MGRIFLEHRKMLELAAIIKIIKYNNRPVNEVLMGIFPISLIKKHER